MGVRRKHRSGFFSKVRRLGFLAAIGVAGFYAWQQLQRRRAGSTTHAPSDPASTATRPSAAAGSTKVNATGSSSPPQPAEAEVTAAAQPLSSPAGNGDEGSTGRIKGNAGSMLYHTVDSPNYRRTKAETYFDTEEEAQAAGFQRWDHKRTSGS
jgi:hypothetical protein